MEWTEEEKKMDRPQTFAPDIPPSLPPSLLTIGVIPTGALGASTQPGIRAGRRGGREGGREGREDLTIGVIPTGALGASTLPP